MRPTILFSLTFELTWRTTPSKSTHGLATRVGGILETAQDERDRLLALNPNIVTLRHIIINGSGELSRYPPNSDFWLKDDNGQIIYSEILNGPMVNFMNPELQDIIIERIVGIAECGLYDGIMEENWHQVASQKLQEGHQNRFPAELLSYERHWEGYFAEPSPMRCATLIENHSWRKNVHFIQGALSSETRFTQIHLIEMKVPSVQIRPPKHFIQKFSLQTFTLDDLLDFLDLTPTLLFMDIEFKEMDVLETYSFSRLPDFWMVDMHHREPNIQRACEIFESHGYEILTTTGHPTDKDELWGQRRRT